MDQLTGAAHMKKVIRIVSCVLLFPLIATLLPGGGNLLEAAGNGALRQEMITLDRTFREVVSAVAVMDGQRVREALAPMHGMMEKTHEALHSGLVKIRRNKERTKEFISMDKEFHERLEMLADAARRDDSDKMVALTNDLLSRCVKCHAVFK